MGKLNMGTVFFFKCLIFFCNIEFSLTTEKKTQLLKNWTTRERFKPKNCNAQGVSLPVISCGLCTPDKNESPWDDAKYIQSADLTNHWHCAYMGFSTMRMPANWRSRLVVYECTIWSTGHSRKDNGISSLWSNKQGKRLLVPLSA